MERKFEQEIGGEMKQMTRVYAAAAAGRKSGNQKWSRSYFVKAWRRGNVKDNKSPPYQSASRVHVCARCLLCVFL